MSAIVLIDPATEWIPVLHAAKRKNLVTIAVQLSPIGSRMESFLPTPEVLSEAGIDHVLDLRDRDCYNCVHALQLLKIKENFNLQAVVPLAETAVDYSDVIAAMLGLSYHNPLHLTTSRRDKGMMKEAVLRAGIRVAAFSRIHQLSDIENFMDEQLLEWPVVVKTPQGFSTTDVFICESLEEAEHAFDTIVGNIGPDDRRVAHALIEEYINGTEFAVNMIAFEGMLIVTDVWKYLKTGKARYSQADNCDPSDDALHHVVEYSRRVAHAVGLRYGAAHVEVKAELDFDDVYVDPCMMEVGARFSGGRKATMTQAAMAGSWDPFSALIDSHSGVSPDFPPSFTPKLFVRHLFLPIDTAGYVEDVQLDETNLKTLHSRVIMVKRGDFVEETTDITSFAGFLWFVGEKNDVKQDTERALSSFVLKLTS
jgi:hypothetical protein